MPWQEVDDLLTVLRMETEHSKREAARAEAHSRSTPARRTMAYG